MTPADVKAIRILAKHFGLDGVGYNPRENDEQADDLIGKFGLEVQFVENKKPGGGGGWEGYIAYKDNVEVAAMGGYGERADHRRYAIVHAAAKLANPGWQERFHCFEEGLDPFKMGHIVDARSYDDA